MIQALVVLVWLGWLMAHTWLSKRQRGLMTGVVVAELALFGALIVWLWVQLAESDGTGGAAAYVYLLLGLVMLVLPAGVGGWTLWKNRK